MTIHGPGRAAQRVSGHRGPRICLSGHHLVSHQSVASVCLCFWYALQNAFAVVACFNAGGILFQLSGTLCEKKFFITSSLVAWYDNLITTQFLAPVDCLNIPAQLRLRIRSVLSDPGCLPWIRIFPFRIQGQTGNRYRTGSRIRISNKEF
jgi:hypothetical protein